MDDDAYKIIEKMREECEGCPYLGKYDCKADPYIDGCFKEKNEKTEIIHKERG